MKRYTSLQIELVFVISTVVTNATEVQMLPEKWWQDGARSRFSAIISIRI